MTSERPLPTARAAPPGPPTTPASPAPPPSSASTEPAASAASPSSPVEPAGHRSRWLLVLGILLVSASLRPSVSSVGPVLADIKADLSLTSVQAALLTSLPVLCFGLLAPLAPRLGRRFGIEATIAAVVSVIALGLVVRLGPNPFTLFVGTLVAGGAVAIANVLVPPLIRRDFPRQIGLMTGVYTASMTLTSTIAAAVTVPLGVVSGLGWRGGLGFWALPAAAAVVAWLPQLRDRTTPPTTAAGGVGALLRDPLAWQATVFFGLQSCIFYATIAWLPSVYRDQGLSPTDAGLLLSVTTLVAIPSGLVVTWRAGRARNQRAAAAGATCVATVGLLGLALAPGAAPLAWAVILGIGQGITFPLALTILVLRSRSVAGTQRLSAMVQSIGYAVASLGPLAVGLLHDATGGWAAGLGVLVGLGVIQGVAGFMAGRDATVAAS